MQNIQEFEGIYKLGKNGIAFITNKETKEVYEIPAHLHKSALNRDLVRVAITNEKEKQGEILEILERSQKGYLGELHTFGEHFKFKADDFRIPEVIIPNTKTSGASTKDKVFIVIDQYEPKLVGYVEKNLGPSSNDAKMKGFALEQGFDFEFPEEVQKEAELLEEKGITDADREGRRDMREALTFTIDPQDAKDFDDALSFETLSNGNYEIGIHIADVAHYVRPGTALDEEAQKRTTSVYLVDRTIPMLPEELSNGLCSLRQDEEKCAFSAVFEINPQNGDVVNEWYGRTLIKSNKRFTYEEAQEIIDDKEGLYAKELMELNRISKIYEKDRAADGALNFETHEVKFVLDEKGKPISVKVKERIDTNKLIEEFMLLANAGVAKYCSGKDTPFFIYRIHDKPEFERAEKLHEFLKLLGYSTELVDGRIPVERLQAIIKEAEGSPVYDTLQTAIVRSMQKAVYTTQNIGHFGLAFTHYSHFTSPIRRYPDVLAHRLLQHKINGAESEFDQAWHEKLCAHSSQQEQNAVKAERSSIKLKQVEFMAQKDKSEIFDGIVTGTGKFGVFVAEAESLSEGMIRLNDLGDDFWEYKEKTGQVIGKTSGKNFKLGDRIKMKIKKVDIEKNLIDYMLLLSKEEIQKLKEKRKKNFSKRPRKFDNKKKNK